MCCQPQRIISIDRERDEVEECLIQITCAQFVDLMNCIKPVLEFCVSYHVFLYVRLGVALNER